MKRVISIAMLASLPNAFAFAEDDPQSKARYVMQATEKGTLRLDTKTGVTSLCTTSDGQLRCEVSAEERAAYEAEIDALGSRLETLEQRIIALEVPEGGTTPPDGVAKEDEVADEAEGEEPTGRSASFVSRAARGFVGTVKRWRRSFDGG